MILKLFKNKKVIITGNTGFKGSWLTIWLNILGAEIYGFSLKSPTYPSMYNLTSLSKTLVEQNKKDIRDFNEVNKFFKKIQPDFVFHLAAQSLVTKSFEDPMNTWSTNVIGTLNVLESLKSIKKRCSVIIVTSDKCYENREINRGYRETDRLGGIDPYSSSKASAEILFNSFYKSYFTKSKLSICSVRAGNVIGGGDWALRRIIPDCMQSWSKNKILNIRNPNATRPWQHVLEPISGYLQLAAELYKNGKYTGNSFNFGPSLKNEFTVKKLITEMSGYWKKPKWNHRNNKENNLNIHESILLKLNCNKAYKILGWKQNLDFQQTVKFTVEWYINYYSKKINLKEFTENQIKDFIKIAKKNKLRWIK